MNRITLNDIRNPQEIAGKPGHMLMFLRQCCSNCGTKLPITQEDLARKAGFLDSKVIREYEQASGELSAVRKSRMRQIWLALGIPESKLVPHDWFGTSIDRKYFLRLVDKLGLHIGIVSLQHRPGAGTGKFATASIYA